MRVINQGGYLHENISRIWLEEDCRFTGRRQIFHRIWGHDEDKDYDFVLDWGIDRQQVRDCYEKMEERLQGGTTRSWNCPRYGLCKDEDRRNVKHECSSTDGQAYQGSGRKVYAGTGTKSRSKVYAGR